MAGIDKIFLTDYNEYKYLEQFCVRYNQEFFDKHNYYLSIGLYDDISPNTFVDGKEHIVSNFSTEADICIIQHLSETDIENMPNVVARLKQQYYREFDLIKEHKSVYDNYQIDYSGCKVRLVRKSNNKTLRHIKREVWDRVEVFVYSSKIVKKEKDFQKYILDFDYFRRIIFNKRLGCRYYKELPCEDTGSLPILHNVSMNQVYKYITRVRIKQGITILVFCTNYKKDSTGTWVSTKNQEYVFEVI
jgi:hypothetical protein